MPRWDGTGPRGMGPMTGKSMGYCSRRYPRRRLNRYGRGMGEFGGWSLHPFGPEEERTFLEDEKAYLETRLEEIDTVLEKADEK